MFTRAPWEVTGGYLEGNYNMGGAGAGGGKLLDEAGKIVTGGDSTHYEDMGKGLDKKAGDEFETLKRGPGDKNAFNEGMRMIMRNVDEVGNFIANDPRGHNRRLEQKRQRQKEAEEAALAAKAAGQTYGQEGKKKKKKKGLLALSTPSAQAGRFRSGKRRFRVRPTGATGVNVAGSGGGSTVGTS